MAVTLGGTTLSNIIDTLFSETSKAPLKEFVNTRAEVSSNIWSKKPLRIAYIMRITHAQKWALDVKLDANAQVVLNDTTYSINTNAFIVRTEATYEGNVNWAFPWKYEIEVIIVT